MRVGRRQLHERSRTLHAVDYPIDVDARADSADVEIVAAANACEECLVPKPLRQSMLGPVLGIDPASIRLVYPTDFPGDHAPAS